jgi:hypothetical protein
MVENKKGNLRAKFQASAGVYMLVVGYQLPICAA